MRLIGRLKRIEEWARSRSERRAVAAVGIAWTGAEERWPGEPGEDVRLVLDVHVMGESDGTPEWTLRERPARDAGDEGDVFDAAGLRLGRVVRREGSLLVWCDEDGDADAGAAAG